MHRPCTSTRTWGLAAPRGFSCISSARGLPVRSRWSPTTPLSAEMTASRRGMAWSSGRSRPEALSMAWTPASAASSPAPIRPVVPRTLRYTRPVMPRVGVSATLPKGGETRAMRECIASTMSVTPRTPSTASLTPPRISLTAPPWRFGSLPNAGLLGLGLAAGNHRRDGRGRAIRRPLLGRRSVLLGFLRHLVAALVAFGHVSSDVVCDLVGRYGNQPRRQPRLQWRGFGPLEAGALIVAGAFERLVTRGEHLVQVGFRTACGGPGLRRRDWPGHDRGRRRREPRRHGWANRFIGQRELPRNTHEPAVGLGIQGHEPLDEALLQRHAVDQELRFPMLDQQPPMDASLHAGSAYQRFGSQPGGWYAVVVEGVAQRHPQQLTTGDRRVGRLLIAENLGKESHWGLPKLR